MPHDNTNQKICIIEILQIVFIKNYKTKTMTNKVKENVRYPFCL